MVIQEQRGLVKRRSFVMEIQSAEVRRLHIVYFLSRKGHIEHPHLLRVHHLSRNGVRLRDIKRWLGELRGKDMPHSFSWSYKRKYKTGYLWQDLMDDDLVTPISDNEYVLKGSEISSLNIVNKKGGLSFCDEKVQKNEASLEAKEEVYRNKKFSKEEEKASHSPSSSEASSIYKSPKSSSGEILQEEESPTFGSETFTLTDDTPKPQRENEKQQAKDEIEKSSSPFYSTLLSNNKKKNKRKDSKVVKILDEKTMDTTPPMNSSSPSKANNLSKSKSNKFRHLITCGAVETNESAMVMINKQNYKPFLNMCSSSDLEKNVLHSAEICKTDHYKQLGSSQRIFGNPKWTQPPRNGRKSIDGIKDSTKSNKSEIREPRKLINGPTCSQCGKQFKPDKLTSHMKSCKGMKAALSSMAAFSVISSATSETSSTISQRGPNTGPRDENPLSGYLLAH